MRSFHISDVLTATTGRLVSSRHMDGVYDIYNFLTGDSLFTHQLPRAARECEPWLRAQFPRLMEDGPGMPERLAAMDTELDRANGNRELVSRACDAFVEQVRVSEGLPAMIPVYELGADMHTHIDPVEEARAMVGDEKVIALHPEYPAS